MHPPAHSSSEPSRHTADEHRFDPATRSHRAAPLGTLELARPAIVLFLMLFVMSLGLSLDVNDGRFIYTLDDPYIHLELARHIAEGNYGLNDHEVSSPSSSIVWPYLLTPFSRFAFFEYVPLAINVLCGVGVLVVVAYACSRIFDSAYGSSTRFAASVFVVAFVVVGNLSGLAFTGMEHLLQLLCTTAIVAGLIVELETARAPRWLFVAIAIAPFVRYENLSVSGVALLLLASRRHWRMALVTGGMIAVGVAGFSLYLHSLGLPYLPSSILAKRSALGSDGFFRGLLHDFLVTISRVRYTPLIVLAIFALLLLLHPFLVRNRRDESRLAVGLLAAVAVHYLIGSFDWLSRYEVYIYAPTALALLYLYRTQILRWIEHGSRLAFVAVTAIVVGIAGFPYLVRLATVQNNSNGIYSIQYQMHRLVNEFYRRPVAVNDIGWVAFGGEHHVLDLWGLASVDALRLRQMYRDNRWMDTLVTARNVELAMIFPSWFEGGAPDAWKHVATLRYDVDRSYHRMNDVYIYSTADTLGRDLDSALRRFERTLPPQSELLLIADTGATSR